MRTEVGQGNLLEALASAGPEQHSTVYQQKEAAADNRAALQISARSDSDSHTQLNSVALTKAAQEPQPDTLAVTCRPDMHLPAASKGSSSAEALLHRVSTGSGSEQRLAGTAVPAGVRRLLSEESEEGGYSSSPSSTESTLLLKPLTPAQSWEHRIHDLKARMHDAMKSAAGPRPAALPSAEADNISCEVCGISATSPDLLEQHLQGRKHLRRLAEEADAAGIRQSVEYPCDVCNVVTSSEGQLAVHMDGKRHRKHILMAEVTNSQAADADASEEELHCELCDVTAPSSTHKQIHLRGQKHQRREKQEQHLTDAQQACNSTLDALLDDPSTDDVQQSDVSALHIEQRQPGEQAPDVSSTGGLAAEDAHEVDFMAEKAASGDAEADAEDSTGILVSRGRAAVGVSGDEEVEFQGCGVPSAFADPSSFGGGANDTASEGGSGGDAPGDSLGELPRRTLTLRPSGMRVRFSQSFDEDALSDSEDSMRRLSSKPPLAPSGGSVSLAAQHFCPVCGIIATSQANLEDHVRGRRHARRLQYIGNMPESERTPFMQRVASGDWHLLRRRDSGGSTGSNGDAMALLRIGSITLPSSMDLRQYLEQMQEVGDGDDLEPEDGVAADATDAAPNGGMAAAATAAVHPEGTTLMLLAGEAAGGGIGTHKEGVEEFSDAGDSEDTELAMAEGSIDSGNEPKERHECIVCGITTTSAAHLEAHLRGRKHKRRVEVSGGRLQRPSSHYCKICDITTTSAQHMAMHVAGKAHLRRLTTGHLPAAAAQAVAASGTGVAAALRADSSAGATLQHRMAVSVSSSRQPSPAPRTAGEAAAAAATSAAVNRIDQDGRSASVRSADRIQLPMSKQMPQQLHQQAQWALHQQQQQQQQMQQQMPSMQQGAMLHSSPPYGVQYVGYYPQQQAFYPPQVAGHQCTLPGYLPPAAWGQWLPNSGAFPSAVTAAHGAGYHQLPAMYAVPQLSPRYGYQAAFPPQQQPPGSYPGAHFAKTGGGGYAAAPRPMAVPQQNGADYNCEVCGTNAPDLETYKQHIRTKPHVRRINNNRPGGP